MATKVYRDLFSEKPYGAALASQNLAVRCSNCFAENASIPCKDGKDGCHKIVYCSAECREVDAPNHTYECLALKKVDAGNIDQFVRLLARILTRRLVDKGVVNLCENFPPNVRDRCLDDLMPHQCEIEANEYRSSEMKKALKEFRNAYDGTPLMNDWELVKTMYCIMWINCFSVSGPIDLSSGNAGSLGLGFYLNISRFNHACKPDLHVFFDGSLLTVQYLSKVLDAHQAAVAKERSTMTWSAKKFNRMTISYGFSGAFSNDAYFPLRRQRQESLSFGYYFKCHCSLCADEKAAALEENAAAVECFKCGNAFLWKETGRRPAVLCWKSSTAQPSKIVCVKSCSCSLSELERAWVKNFLEARDPMVKLKDLDGRWTEAMSFRMSEVYAEKIIERCEPVWEEAKQYWHQTDNLRMAQLQERLFIAYSALALHQWKQNQLVRPNILRMAIGMGELAVGWYQKHGNETCDTAMAAYGHELAKLYEMEAAMSKSNVESETACKKASYWYSYAASIWQSYGERAASFVRILNSKADEALAAACADHEQPVAAIDDDEAIESSVKA